MLAMASFLPLVEFTADSPSDALPFRWNPMMLPVTTEFIPSFLILLILQTVAQVNLHKPIPFSGHIYKVIYIADNCITVKDS